MSDVPLASIPVIDMAPYFVDEGVVVGKPPTDAQKATAATINECCTNHGFAHITNFGLTAEVEAAAFAASEELFGLPDSTKSNDLTRISPETNTGYSPYAFEMLNRSRPPDLKEAFNVRSPEIHPTDGYFSACPDAFRTKSLALWDVLALAARRYSLACAVALGLESDYFAKTLKRMDLCTCRFLHYPPCEVPVDGSELKHAIRVGEHTDFGAFTFLLLGQGAEGLQIKPIEGSEAGGAFGGEDGGWLGVPPPPPRDAAANAKGVSALVNTGACLARWTNDVWRATAHRVIVPSAAVASRHRYSIACFIDPDAAAKVAVDGRFVKEGEAPKYPETTGLDYLLSKLREAQGVDNKEPEAKKHISRKQGLAVA
jgi:isopenicillin N synthase-like dioxygenase